MSSNPGTSLSELAPQLDGINPSLTRYGRSEPAPVLPLREEPDLLSWLETSGRLVADEEAAPGRLVGRAVAVAVVGGEVAHDHDPPLVRLERPEDRR